AVKNRSNEPKAITIQRHNGRPTENFYSSFARPKRTANPSRRNCRSCQWPVAILSRSPICQKARATRLGRRTERQLRLRARQIRRIWQSRKRKRKRKKN